MAKLPKAVQDQLDAAETLEREMVETPPATQPEDDAPPAPEPEPTPQPPAPEPQQPSDDDDSWRVKYLTLQGMHRADVTRLTGEVDALKATVTDLQKQLADTTKPPAPAPEPEAKLLTQADIDAFGPDMIDVIERAAKQLVASEIGPLKSELAAVKQENATLKGTVDTVAETQSAQGQNVFVSQLTDAVPDWQKVNIEPAFLAWLGETDPLSGAQRQALLNVAVEAQDAKRVAAIFNAWKATQAPTSPPPPAPKDDLTKQIQPGTTHGSTPPAPTQAKTWSPDEIDKFYRDVARGAYKGREAEAERIEAEIDRSLTAMGAA